MLEFAGAFYMLQACIQGNFFLKPKKFSKFRRIGLHCPLLQIILKTFPLLYEHEHVVFTLYFLNYSSDLIPTSQIGLSR